MKSDPFSDITTFVRTAEAGNFTRAARMLRISQPAVSKAIARLEAELGVRLFHRSPRHIALTSDGEVFFNACRHSLTTVEDARSTLAGPSSMLQGKLRLSVPVSFGQYVVAPALHDWLTAYPGLEVELILTDRHVDMTAERFDLAVLLGEVPDSRLLARPLPPHRFLTAAAPSYLQRHGEPSHPEELAKHACLPYIMANSGQFRHWTFIRDRQQFRHRPEGPLATDHAVVLLAMAQDGQGIIQAPYYVLANAVQEGRLVPVLRDYQTEGAPLTVVYEKSRQLSERTQCAARFLLALGAQL